MLVAPTEPPLLRRLGEVSSTPERFGADFFWVTHAQKCGVQRKTMSDYVASIVDGRLGKEIGQMQQLGPIRVLILEGPVNWTVDGAWMGRGFRWDHSRHDQSILSLFAAGILTIRSDGMQDTIRLLGEIERWSRKEKHQFGRARGAAVGQWGTPSSREYGTYALQSLPGVGPELAERVYDHFGRVPWTWACSENDLLAIDGIGKVRAQRLLSCFAPAPAAPSPDTSPTPSATPSATPSDAPPNPYPSTDTPQATSSAPLPPTSNGRRQ